MNEHKASRTLVKSPPELWAECSDASSLTRHLDHFGEITITKLEPEIAVAWEGERVSGTVRLEPSGWGTRVTLTAAVEPAVEPAVADDPEPVASHDPEPEPEPPTRPPADGTGSRIFCSDTDPYLRPPAATERPRGLFARLFGFLGGQRAAGPPGPPAPALTDPEPEPEPEPEATLPPEAVAAGPEPAAREPEPTALDATSAEPDPEERALAPESPIVADLLDAEAALVAALDSLGQAHHRPFSRA